MAGSRADFRHGQVVKSSNLTGQDFDPGRMQVGVQMPM